MLPLLLLVLDGGDAALADGAALGVFTTDTEC